MLAECPVVIEQDKSYAEEVYAENLYKEIKDSCKETFLANSSEDKVSCALQTLFENDHDICFDHTKVKDWIKFYKVLSEWGALCIEMGGAVDNESVFYFNYLADLDYSFELNEILDDKRQAAIESKCNG